MYWDRSLQWFDVSIQRITMRVNFFGMVFTWPNMESNEKDSNEHSNALWWNAESFLIGQYLVIVVLLCNHWPIDKIKLWDSDEI